MRADVHEKIREIRQKSGLTMQQLAEAVGTSQQQIDRLEKGRRRLTVEWLERLSAGLDCQLGEFIPSAQKPREGDARTVRAKVIGQADASGNVRWIKDEERYTLMVGRPEGITNAKLFAIRGAAGDELIFAETNKHDGIPSGITVLCMEGGSYALRITPCAPESVRARLVRRIS